MTEIVISREAVEAAFNTFNTATFLIYGMDKFLAKIHGRRVPERILLLLSIIGGSIGALGGMLFFRHKTKHWKFRIIVPLSLIAHLILYSVYW